MFDRFARGVLMNPLTAIVGGGQVAGGLLGGWMQGRAANKAADIQERSARIAADKIATVTDQVNPAIGAAATTAGNQVVDTAGQAAGSVVDAGNIAKQGVATATGQANELLDPYIGTGTDALGQLSAMLKGGFTADNFKQLDPGFDFRVKEAQKAVERSAAARGGALGGGALKALQDRSQGLASEEFGAAHGRWLQGLDRLGVLANMGLGASTTSGDRTIGSAKYGGDVGLTAATTAAGLNTDASRFKAGIDVDAANRMAQNSINSAGAYGDYMTGGANARAAGTVAGGNAMAGGITGGLSGATNLLLLRQLLQNPQGGGGMPTTQQLAALPQVRYAQSPYYMGAGKKFGA